MRLLIFVLNFLMMTHALSQDTESDSQTKKILKKVKENRWNVCGVTINSPDEFQTMKKNLPADKFNFIELTDFGKIQELKKQKKKQKELPSSEEWLANACKSGIRCDVLVISGHFTPTGRAFYSAHPYNSPYRLSLDSLQSYACSEDCKNIINSATEVFLFGCNSLNNSCATTLDPIQAEQMRQDAMQTLHFTPAQAQTYVSSYQQSQGQSVKEIMKEVFAGAKAVYGFDGIAPSGGAVAPALKKYFDEINKRYPEDGYAGHLGDYLVGALAEKRIFNNPSEIKGSETMSKEDIFYFNQTLDKHVSQVRRSFTQCSADEVVIDEVFEFKKGVRTITCKFMDKRTPKEEKLRILNNLVYRNMVLSYLPAISHFLNEFMQSSHLTDEDKIFIEDLKNNESLKKEFTSIAKVLPLGTYINNILGLNQKLGWMTPEEIQTILDEKLKSFLFEPIYSSSASGYVCDLYSKNKIKLSTLSDEEIKKIDASFIKTKPGLESLKCLNIGSMHLFEMLKNEIKIQNDYQYRSLAMRYLGKPTYLTNPEVFEYLINTGIKDKHAEVRYDAAESLYNNIEQNIKGITYQANAIDRILTELSKNNTRADYENEEVTYPLHQGLLLLSNKMTNEQISKLIANIKKYASYTETKIPALDLNYLLPINELQASHPLNQAIKKYIIQEYSSALKNKELKNDSYKEAQILQKIFTSPWFKDEDLHKQAWLYLESSSTAEFGDLASKYSLINDEKLANAYYQKISNIILQKLKSPMRDTKHIFSEITDMLNINIDATKYFARELLKLQTVEHNLNLGDNFFYLKYQQMDALDFPSEAKLNQKQYESLVEIVDNTYSPTIMNFSEVKMEQDDIDFFLSAIVSKNINRSRIHYFKFGPKNQRDILLSILDKILILADEYENIGHPKNTQDLQKQDALSEKIHLLNIYFHEIKKDLKDIEQAVLVEIGNRYFDVYLKTIDIRHIHIGTSALGIFPFTNENFEKYLAFNMGHNPPKNRKYASNQYILNNLNKMTPAQLEKLKQSCRYIIARDPEARDYSWNDLYFCKNQLP
ncbi:MAG: hypothetical protein JNM93_11395 [Bacteriovoracaceae bacterium]|nr:hypothetical protein [Bacteriovoracaceae bacterium]